MQLMLIINPGSTSTKLSIYDGLNEIKTETLRHQVEELKKFSSVAEQKNYRQTLINKFLKENNYDLSNFTCIVGRGGLLRPIKSGTYLVNQQMVDDLKANKYGEHASNLGGMIAFEYGNQYHIPAYIVDPVVVDEMNEISRLSGTALFPRRCAFHALNHKAIAKRYAKEVNKKYTDLNLIVAHLGGGISVGWHHLGQVIDVNNALGGDGPYSPERAGGLPPFELIDLCFDSKKTKREVMKCVVGNGGLMSYTGTNNVSVLEEKANQGDQKIDLYIHGMAYQVAKEIGSLYFVANGKIDAILLTGGITYSKLFMKYLENCLKGICPYKVYQGEDEMLALAQGALRVINNEEKAHTY